MSEVLGKSVAKRGGVDYTDAVVVYLLFPGISRDVLRQISTEVRPPVVDVRVLIHEELRHE